VLAQAVGTGGMRSAACCVAACRRLKPASWLRRAHAAPRPRRRRQRTSATFSWPGALRCGHKALLLREAEPIRQWRAEPCGRSFAAPAVHPPCCVAVLQVMKSGMIRDLRRKCDIGVLCASLCFPLHQAERELPACCMRPAHTQGMLLCSVLFLVDAPAESCGSLALCVTLPQRSHAFARRRSSQYVDVGCSV